MFVIFLIHVRLTVNITHSDGSGLKTLFTSSDSICPLQKDDVWGK